MRRQTHFALVILFAAACAAGTSGPANAQDPVLEFSSSTSGTFTNSDVSAGWLFTLNVPIKVTALDAFAGADPGNVRLYNVSGTIVSATLVDTDPTEGAPFSFYTQPITPTVLTPGIYGIAEDLAENLTTTNALATGLTTDSAIAYTATVVTTNFGEDPFLDATSGVDVPGFFGPNFDFAPPAPEPSPLEWGPFIFGIVGIAVYRRRRQQV